MQYCHKCAKPIEDDDINYCPYCGNKLEKDLSTSNAILNKGRDVIKLRDEIDYFYKRRKIFLFIALGCLGLGLIFFIVGIIVGSNASNVNGYSVFVYLASLFISGFVVLMILRSALYNRRIKNRKELLKEAGFPYHKQ